MAATTEWMRRSARSMHARPDRGWVRDMAIQKIDRKKIWEEVADKMQALIISGFWQKGERLPGEVQLAKEFGVSRSTLREAIRQLSSKGLVQVRHGEGTFVWYPEADEFMSPLLPRLIMDREDITSIMEARSMVEVETARLAALRRTDEELARLQELFEQMKESVHDRKRFAKKDHAFHKQVALAAHNPIIIKIYEAVEVFLVSQQLRIVDLADALERGVSDHQVILGAITNGDGPAAAEAMLNHIKHTQAAVNKRSEILVADT